MTIITVIIFCTILAGVAGVGWIVETILEKRGYFNE